MKHSLTGCPLVVGALCLLAGCASLNFDMCGNTITRQAISPDGKLKAVVFSRDCGATTSESVQVSLVEATAPLPDEAGNIFIAEQANIYIKWLSASKLQITVPANIKVSEQEAKYGAVVILYK